MDREKDPRDQPPDARQDRTSQLPAPQDDDRDAAAGKADEESSFTYRDWASI